MGASGRNFVRGPGRTLAWATFTLMIFLDFCHGIEHNLPEGVELVDPKDLGLDTQFDLDKLLGNVKALPIDTNALSSALGKPGLKTQVLTVGFDGSEGLNLDDFELPHLKNDEHAPLAHEAFKSFKNFFKNSSMATQVPDDPQTPAPTAPVQFSKPVPSQRSGGKRKTMMRRRKVVRVNATTTTPPPVQPEPAASSSAGPKVIELDSSQIEKLIASGKIGPPKSLTPGGPQVIELGQSDLDALLNSENGDEIKQILEGGDTIQNFDLSQLQRGVQGPSEPQLPPSEYGNRVTESIPQVSQTQFDTSPEPTSPPVSQTTVSEIYSTEETPATTPPQQVASVTTTSLPPTSVSSEYTQPPTTPTTGLPIIYQYNSAQDVQTNNQIPPQGVQGAIPLQFYSSHANGHQQARLVKTPTFEFISAPPVSFSSSVIQNQNQQQLQQLPQTQQQYQPQTLFIQPQPQFQHQFIALPQPQQESQQQFIPGPPPPIQESQQEQRQQQQQQQFQPTSPPSPPPTPKPYKKDSSLNKIVPASQTSQHTEQVKLKSNSLNSNYITSLHKVNLPLNSVKLVTPSPQHVHSVLSQVPDSFQPSIIPNHIVSSPVLDPLRVGNPSASQSTFLRPSQQQPIQQSPFRNTNLFSNSISTSQRSPSTQPIRTHPSAFVRFPSASNQSPVLNPVPNRFRVSESQNPFFTFRPNGGFGNLVLNSFVAGDGLNYRGRSREDFHQPGI